MSRKIFLVVLLLNVLGSAIASNVHSRHVRSTTLSISDIVSEIKNLVNETTEATSTSTEVVANITEEYTTQITDEINEIEESVTTAASNVVGDNTTDSAVYECTSALVAESEETIAEIKSDFAACIESSAESIEELKSVVSELTTVTESAISLLVEIQTGTATCEAKSSTLAQTVCKAELAVTSAASFATLSAEAITLMSEVTTLKSTLKTTMEDCTSTSIAKASLSETEILAEIALCPVTSSTSS